VRDKSGEKQRPFQKFFVSPSLSSTDAGASDLHQFAKVVRQTTFKTAFSALPQQIRFVVYH